MTAGAINVSFGCSRYFWRLRFQLQCYLAETMITITTTVGITGVSWTPLLALGLLRCLPIPLVHHLSRISARLLKITATSIQTLLLEAAMVSGKKWDPRRML